jgi:hypothetical protein
MIDDIVPMGGNTLAMLNQLAEDQLAAEQALLDAEESVERAKAHLNDISQRQIPEALEELGLTQFATDKGLTIEIKEKIYAGLSEKNRPAGIKWLEDNGLGALVKRKVSIYAPKGSPERAQSVAEMARTAGLEVDDALSVHPTSLTAALREKLEEGEDVPVELFGILRKRFSKIVKVKK